MRRMSEDPIPCGPPATTEGRPRIVTIGGGHGQAIVLEALCQLDCDITAVVSIADDGGCSGRLRREFGMPPPGDLRRCLTTLARDRDLAARFEVRSFEFGDEARSAGNLALSAAYQEFGSLQRAVDWAAGLLRCRGRVVPVAESPGVLVVYDRLDGPVEGETAIEHQVSAPMAAMVHGPTQTNPVAVEALREANYVLIGPGSFFTSILATLTTADVAQALVETSARCVLLANLASEGAQTAGMTVQDYARLVRDHLTIASVGGTVPLSVLCHESAERLERLDDGAQVYVSALCADGANKHDAHLVAAALVEHLGLTWRDASRLSALPVNDGDKVARFEAFLSSARDRLSHGKAST